MKKEFKYCFYYNNDVVWYLLKLFLFYTILFDSFKLFWWFRLAIQNINKQKNNDVLLYIKLSNSI